MIDLKKFFFYKAKCLNNTKLAKKIKKPRISIQRECKKFKEMSDEEFMKVFRETMLPVFEKEKNGS